MWPITEYTAVVGNLACYLTKASQECIGDTTVLINLAVVSPELHENTVETLVIYCEELFHQISRISFM